LFPRKAVSARRAPGLSGVFTARGKARVAPFLLVLEQVTIPERPPRFRAAAVPGNRSVVPRKAVSARGAPGLSGVFTARGKARVAPFVLVLKRERSRIRPLR
jgi:hypothetical protein